MGDMAEMVLEQVFSPGGFYPDYSDEREEDFDSRNWFSVEERRAYRKKHKPTSKKAIKAWRKK